MRAATLVGLVLLAGCSRLDRFRGSADVEAAPSVANTPAGTAPLAATGPAGLAFPGAEGFGAMTRGGRGGAVCRVTSLAKTGAGTLQACFDQTGPRTVIFDVSGVIQGPLEIKHGRITVAGQTSPGGITVKGGIVCDNVYDPNDCHDVILRHLRLRGGEPDSLRIGGAHDVIVDHCSMAGAEDENVELTRSSRVTIQRSIIAEPRGEHYKWGGVLMNYSKDVMPLDAISIHHSLWSGVAGRLPEISCEDNDDGPGKSRCAGHVLSLELSNNVMWDVSDPIWFNRCTGNNQGNDCAPSAPGLALRLNFVGNVLARRSSTDAQAPIAEPVLFDHRGGQVYAKDNAVLHGAAAGPTPPARGTTRQPFPAITYTAREKLLAEIAATAGALPHDAMDARLTGYLAKPVDARPAAWRNDSGVDFGDAYRPLAVGAKLPDADGDGMPDAWETAHGTNPKVADGASAGRCGGPYTALECYLNQLR